MRFATAACMQKYGNVSFATVACAKCMRYGGRGGGDPYHGGVATRDTEPYIYIYIYIYIYDRDIHLEPKWRPLFLLEFGPCFHSMFLHSLGPGVNQTRLDVRLLAFRGSVGEQATETVVGCLV